MTRSCSPPRAATIAAVISAALFSLEGGDVRSVELPERGHDIALRPGTNEWVAFARRPGRFGVAVPTDGRAPTWFNAKADRHFFGHGVFSADGKLLYTTENDYARAQGIIGIRDATDGYKQIGEFSARGMEPHDVAAARRRPHHGHRQWRHRNPPGLAAPTS